MPRKPRMRSSSNIYHVMLRGNERKDIFRDEEDRIKFLDILYEKNKQNIYSLYAYCLMDNHIHLIVDEKDENISNIIKTINVSYVYYFNKKYKRVGHLFQDRFRSEPIENEGYLLAAIRYIHNNPIKAEMVKNAMDYRWSSYNGYFNKNKFDNKIVDRKFPLSIFSQNNRKAIEMFAKYSGKEDDIHFIDIDDNAEKIDIEEIKKYIVKFLCDKKCININKNKKIFKELVSELRTKYEISIRKTAELLLVDRGRVQRVKV